MSLREVMKLLLRKRGEENELEDVIREEDKELQRRHTRAEKNCNYGPKFSLAYNNDNSESSIDTK